jgi:3-oxoadipate enol-lactonase
MLRLRFGFKGDRDMRSDRSGVEMRRALYSVVCTGVLALGMTMPPQAASKPQQQTNWIRANGLTFRYRLEGNGPDTIVLLHESGTGIETWDYVVPELIKNHRVLRYDLRGFGLSQLVKTPYTIHDETADLREILKLLKISSKVHVVGVAIGGALALAFAADYPELTANVIAISPAAYLQGRSMQGMGAGGGGVSGPPGGAPGGVPAGAAGGAAASGPPGGVNMEAMNEGAYPTRMRQQGPERYERYQALQASAASAGAGTGTMSAIYSVKYAELLPTIKVPAVVAATSLWIRPVEEYKALADAIPNGRFEVLETGHFAALASPDLVSALIKKYVK